MSELKPVVHQNFVLSDGQNLFCKKRHKVVNLKKNSKYCSECPYLYGLLQGEGVECAWMDIFEEPFMCIDNPQKEFDRVDGLVNKKILTRG